jgi:hypothetical protein
LAEGLLALLASLGVHAEIAGRDVAVSGAGEVAEPETDEQPFDQDRAGGAELLDAEAGPFGAAREAFAGYLPPSAAVGVDVFVVAVAGEQFVVGEVRAGQRAEARPVARARE